LDPVVAAREGLIDGVVEQLVDELVEAAEAGRADVHPGPEPDRLETFEDGDVLCGVVRFSHEKSPANKPFAGWGQCIRTTGRAGAEPTQLLSLSRQIRVGPDHRSKQSSPQPHAPARG